MLADEEIGARFLLWLLSVRLAVPVHWLQPPRPRSRSLRSSRSFRLAPVLILVLPEFPEVLGMAVSYPHIPPRLADLFALVLKLLLIRRALLWPSLLELRLPRLWRFRGQI